jgi:hypothetical protein
MTTTGAPAKADNPEPNASENVVSPVHKNSIDLLQKMEQSPEQALQSPEKPPENPEHKDEGEDIKASQEDSE